jgi:hypothetical protein
MFDTNVLFTQVAADLVRHSIKSHITENSTHTDLDVVWHLPKIVVSERRYQMISKAKELLPSMQKMERLLGHGFGIGDDTLSLHVDRAIDECVRQLNIQVSDIDVSAIDWMDLINRSVNRLPPFEQSEKEKGFRDSIIAHSFMNLVRLSPATPNICRLALVTEDQRLRDYVAELTSGSKNVRILSSLDELESLINTLVSSIPEEFAAELTEKAAKIFFDKDDQNTFYYKQNIRDRIREKYSKELETSPIEGLQKKSRTWWISDPVFIKKVKSRIYWTSSIQPEFEVFHYENADPEGASDVIGALSSWSDKEFKKGLFTQLTNKKRVVDFTARDVFDVHWSTNLSSAKNLTAPKLEDIEYVGDDIGD